MKKLGLVIAMLLFSMMLSGCNEEIPKEQDPKEDVYVSLILKSNDDIVEEFRELTIDETVDLPIIEEEGYIFLGWTDGEDIYYYEYTVIEDIILEAVFEDIDDVFEVEFDEGTWREIKSITYQGDATVLTLPTHFEGVLLEDLRLLFIETDSLIKEIRIPKTVSYIGPGFTMLGFSIGLESLEEISFYGDYLGEETLSVSKETYQAMLEEYGDVCEQGTEGDSIYFEEPCPIKEILSISDPVVVGDQEIITYELLMDTRYYDNSQSSLEIEQNAFDNLPSLRTVSFPNRYRSFTGGIFEDVPKLSTVTFGDSDTYTVIDGVVYSEDVSRLYYYPNGLVMEEYHIPSSVVDSGRDFFDENNYLKELYIPASYGGYIYGLADFRALEAIHVEEGSEHLFSDEGVLYSTGIYNQFLVQYPRMKKETSYHIEEGTTRISGRAFYGQEYLEEVVIASTVEHVNDNAFAESKKLTYLDFPASVEYLATGIVYNSAIEYIVVRRTADEYGRVTVINSDQDWPNVYVPDASFMDYVEGYYARGDTSIIYPMSMVNKTIYDLFDYQVTDDRVIIISYKGDASQLKLPPTIEGYKVREIASGAFTKEGLVEIYLPASLEHISEGAFDGVTTLDYISFYGGYKVGLTAHLSEQSLTELTEVEPNICTKIDTGGDYWAYEEGCLVEEVLDIVYRQGPLGDTYPIYIVQMSLMAFEDAAYLTIENGAFSNLEHLSSITFLGRYKDFSGEIFNNTHALESIDFQKYSPYRTLHNQLQIIYLEDTLVYYPETYNLFSFNVGDFTKEIGGYAFTNSQYLMTLTLPSSIELIHENAFIDSSVENVILTRSITENDTITYTRMEYYEGIPTFYVPDDSYEAYLADPVWGQLSEHIKPMSDLE